MIHACDLASMEWKKITCGSSVGKPERKRQFGNLDINGKIILECITNHQEGRP